MAGQLSPRPDEHPAEKHDFLQPGVQGREGSHAYVCGQMHQSLDLT